MPHQFTTSYTKDARDLLRYYKRLGDRAIEQCPDSNLFTALDPESNSIAIIVKHMSGNMRSRWTDFLTSDGEKPDRHRDTEFETPPQTRSALVEVWEAGWKMGRLCRLQEALPLAWLRRDGYFPRRDEPARNVQ